ncbi:MAG: translesion error-prone DNA polymerase V autoproteolytic subunit [Alphaproteobacteria bacterium]|nr:translesion error-prone DNA polymerase V autoproteolytic subunit [Alphaproteobacteria bacterium]
MEQIAVEQVFIPKHSDSVAELPLCGSNIQAGFPSPADDFWESSLDLNEHLIKHPSATFFVRVSGNSMIGAGIHEGDILIVDRSLDPANGKIVIAAIDGMLTVKRLLIKDGKMLLMPENSEFQPIEVNEFSSVHVWGVVTNVIHEV